MERHTHVHGVCSGSEPEYTSDQKDFIFLGGGGGGATSFQFSSRGQQKISKPALE